MDEEAKLGLKVGDLTESRSFTSGFRGAWFRGRILKLQRGGGGLQYHLEYYDYPGERAKWIRVYQLPPCLGERKSRDRELMVRPCYPKIFNQDEMPCDQISEPAAVIDISWQVGDLVDWWTTGSWWSGTILKLLDGGKAQVELKPPPIGQGGTYEVLLKDLRPSLDWDPERGWMLPTQEGDTGRLCPRLIGLVNQVEDRESAVKETETSGGSSVKPSLSSQPSRSSEMEKHFAVLHEVMDTGIQEKTTSSDCGNNNSRKRLSETGTDSGQLRASVRKEPQGSSYTRKSLGVDNRKILHSIAGDSAEAAVLDLEELLGKIKSFKEILLKGASQSDPTGSHWGFFDRTGGASSGRP